MKRRPVQEFQRARRWSRSAYSVSVKDNEKVLDFIKSGGPELTVGRTIFEMWLGSL